MSYAGRFIIPTWAIAPLCYGDYSGLGDLDSELVNAFVDSNFPKGYSVEWTGINEPYICSHPDIGDLTSEVVEADFFHA